MALRRLARPVFITLSFAVLLSGCTCEGSKDESATESADFGEEDRAKVLATVNDKPITLGDYLDGLERMDRFERLRYQSPDRRKELLEQWIDIQLLAEEAVRRGLDKTPEFQERERQLLREEARRDIRAKLPKLEDLPEAEVRAYYDANRQNFTEPERRRVSVIVCSSEAQAKLALAAVDPAEPKSWGEAVQRYSLKKTRTPANLNDARPPLELAGDLGLVSAVDQQEGDNLDVPPVVRQAVFEIEKAGDVLDHVVSEKGRFYVVKLIAISGARSRTFEEAGRTIRVAILKERYQRAEDALIAELRKKIPVVIDENYLKQLDSSPKKAE